MSLRDIADRQAISQKYLWQIVTPLKSAGLLHATRGTQGGYVLACPATEISLDDVVRILEGTDTLVDCLATPDACERSVSCVAREAWLEVEAKLTDALKAITLNALVEKHRDHESRHNPMYMI